MRALWAFVCLGSWLSIYLWSNKKKIEFSFIFIMKRLCFTVIHLIALMLKYIFFVCLFVWEGSSVCAPRGAAAETRTRFPLWDPTFPPFEHARHTSRGSKISGHTYAVLGPVTTGCTANGVLYIPWASLSRYNFPFHFAHSSEKYRWDVCLTSRYCLVLSLITL